MSIQSLIDELSAHRVSLSLRKGQIEASGPKAEINADLVKRLRSKKPEIIRFLTDELLERAVAAAPGVTADDLRANLDKEDWQDSALIAFEPLRGLAHAIHNSRELRAGRVPEGWTATTKCAVCGPVRIFPGGSKTVLGCPWCLAKALTP